MTVFFLVIKDDKILYDAICIYLFHNTNIQMFSNFYCFYYIFYRKVVILLHKKERWYFKTFSTTRLCIYYVFSISFLIINIITHTLDIFLLYDDNILRVTVSFSTTTQTYIYIYIYIYRHFLPTSFKAFIFFKNQFSERSTQKVT